MVVAPVGVNLGPLVKAEHQELAALTRRCLAIDGTPVLVAALRKIRPRGRPLVNRWGEPLASTHGVFYKTLRLLEAGIRPIYVFDGVPPAQKRGRPLSELDRQREHMQKLWQAYLEAREEGDVERVRNLFRSAALTYRKALVDALELLRTMGVPAAVAPSEGEAQGAQLVRSGYADALLTPDYDALLFGCPMVVRRLDLTKQRMDVLKLEEVLSSLGLTREQLVDLAIMVGTDFNPGVPGIGPKRGLALIRRYGSLEHIPNLTLPPDLDRIRSLFLDPPVTHFKPYPPPPNVEMCRGLLLKRGMSPRRADRARQRLLAAHRQLRTHQQTLVPPS